MSNQYAPIWKELALPSEEEKRMYEEWVRQQEEKEREEDSDARVVVIEL